ncbi:MAG: UvrD-helicase domain-containing protein [Chloroflexi bacterium]|nr:UvrD-helicase domain-containing protein [Chloroflexota bacterium]
MDSVILDSMNPAQKAAITAVDGPVLVLAGPGSGKTRVLTHRIVYMVQEYGIPAHRILAVTFTNKAAGEMRERVEQLIGKEDARHLWLGTFHSICVRILRREANLIDFMPDFVIFDRDDQVTLMKQILQDMHLDAQKHPPYGFLDTISSAKNEFILPQNLPIENKGDEIKKKVYEVYQQRLRASNAMDFDDLLVYTVRLLQQYPDTLAAYHYRIPYLLVDEFQDTNMVQYELVRLLAGPRRNVFVVGDPDQSIYSFRGADYRNVKRFQQDFDPQTIFLEENYRSHQYVLDAAMAVIRKNVDHIPRNLFSQRQTGAKIEIHEAYNEREESQFIVDTITELVKKGKAQLRDFAVMYRLNAQSRVLEEAFIHAGLPYLLVGATRFYGRKEIKDALAYLRVIQNPADEVSLLRIINVPARGIGQSTIDQLRAWAASRGAGIYPALQALARGEESPLSGRSKAALVRFIEMIEGWRLLRETVSPLDLLDTFLEETNYVEYLKRDKSERSDDREENIEELRRVASEHQEQTLSEFLEEIALVAETDNFDRTTNAPTLLTLHAAKGLEFSGVFIIGLEEGLLPYRKAIEDANPVSREHQLGEERRLMYVGLTRAKDRLYLIYTFKRMMWGQSDISTPSRFLRDIPPEITTGHAGLKPSMQNMFTQPQKQWDTTWEPSRPRTAKPTNLITGGNPPAAPTQKPHQPTRFKSGQRVLHVKYGEGVVIKSRVHDDIEEVEVLFTQQMGSKRIDGNYLQPLKGEES